MKINYYCCLLIFWIAPISFSKLFAQSELDKQYLLKVNEIRGKGCYCGHRFMPPVLPLNWNEKLTISAMIQAKDMFNFHYFSHFSKEGLDIGQKLTNVGYDWQFAGENIGEGQKSFDEVLHDWLVSKSHCKMLMNPNMKEIGIAHYENLWVQHFGKLMPNFSGL